MNPLDQVMKVLVTQTDKGLKINLLLSLEMVDDLSFQADGGGQGDQTSAHVSRTLGDDNASGIAEIVVETCAPEFKSRTLYAKAVKDPNSRILTVTTL